MLTFMTTLDRWGPIWGCVKVWEKQKIYFLRPRKKAHRVCVTLSETTSHLNDPRFHFSISPWCPLGKHVFFTCKKQVKSLQ